MFAKKRKESGYSKSSIGVTEFSGRGVHNILNRNISPQAITGYHRTQIEERGSASGIRQRLARVYLRTDGASSERIRVGRILVLPVEPNLVDHRVVKEEHGIIRRPPLPRDASRGSQAKWTRPCHLPSEDKMRSRVRPRKGLEIRVEVDKIPWERVHSDSHNLRCERSVDHEEGVRYGRCAWGEWDIQEEGLKGKIAANVVGNGVGDLHILETTGVDLVVIIWVTPMPNAIISGVGKDGRVIKVCGILCPVPIRVNTIVSALRPQCVFESLHVQPMPGEEETRSVDQNVQVHMSIYEIVIVTTVWVNRWN